MAQTLTTTTANRRSGRSRGPCVSSASGRVQLFAQSYELGAAVPDASMPVLVSLALLLGQHADLTESRSAVRGTGCCTIVILSSINSMSLSPITSGQSVRGPRDSRIRISTTESRVASEATSNDGKSSAAHRRLSRCMGCWASPGVFYPRLRRPAGAPRRMSSRRSGRRDSS